MDNVKLTITIKHSEPVELLTLTAALTSLGRLYGDFSKENKDAKLLITEVRKSSIAIDLVAFASVQAMQMFGDAISPFNNIIQFCAYLKAAIGMCKKEKIVIDDTLPLINEQALRCVEKLLDFAKNDTDSVRFDACDMTGSIVYNNCIFTGKDVPKMKRTIKETVGDRNAHFHTKKLFKWTQVNFDKGKTGNRGIIENIYEKPLRVVFSDDITKNQMTTSTDEIDWQKKYYFVDVEVEYDGDVPKFYKIISDYPEDTVPIDD